MSRRKAATKREILPDSKYGDTVVAKFINCLMWDGKKEVAENIVYGAMEDLKKIAEDGDELKAFHNALDALKPSVEVKSRRVGGATFQIPQEIREPRKVAMSMKNMILYARKRPGKSMAEKLAAEIMAAYNNEGGAFKRKEDMHKMAEANKAFAHFRF
jgi:small subunit ribosomal protein S7